MPILGFDESSVKCALDDPVQPDEPASAAGRCQVSQVCRSTFDGYWGRSQRIDGGQSLDHLVTIALEGQHGVYGGLPILEGDASQVAGHGLVDAGQQVYLAIERKISQETAENPGIKRGVS